MCLIALAWRAHRRYPLALIANRDEFHDRPAAPAEIDPDAPDVYGGRDLRQGGGWLQLSLRARLAAVTNVRDGVAAESAPRSRGWLVRDFARGSGTVADALRDLMPRAGDYGRFNLLLWDGGSLAFAGNHPKPVCGEVTPGVHAMSNGAFDAPWPKSSHATRALTAWLAAQADGRALDGDPETASAAIAPLFEALADQTPAPDDALPETGVGLAMERLLSPPFVRGTRYGTRCSSVVLVGEDRALFAERRFGPDAVALGQSLRRLPLRAAG